MKVYACNPCAEGTEIGGSLEFSDQLVSKTSQVDKPKSNEKTLTEKNRNGFQGMRPKVGLQPPCVNTHACMYSYRNTH